MERTFVTRFLVKPLVAVLLITSMCCGEPRPLFLDMGPNDVEGLQKWSDGLTLCNCQENSTCDPVSGDCDPFQCWSPFSGHQCQHADAHILLRRDPEPGHLHSIPSVLNDRNHNTCGINVSEVFIDMGSEAFHFVAVFFYRKLMKKLEIQTVLTGADGYTKSDDYTHNLLELVRIDTNSYELRKKSSNAQLKYSKIYFKNLPTDLCSLEISLGENVGLNAEAGAIGASKYSKNFSPANAINGVIGPSENNACFEAGSSRPVDEQELFVKLAPGTGRINSLVIVFSEEARERCKSSIFYLEYKDKDGMVTHSKLYNLEGAPERANVINMPSVEEVTTVRMVVNMSLNWSIKQICDGKDEPTINVCEMFVFGERLKPKQCPPGQFGPSCERLCGPSCEPKDCDEKLGCIKCPNGTWGTACQHGCRKGSYGRSCAFACSKTLCNGDCMGTTGRCRFRCPQHQVGWECWGPDENELRVEAIHDMFGIESGPSDCIDNAIAVIDVASLIALVLLVYFFFKLWRVCSGKRTAQPGGQSQGAGSAAGSGGTAHSGAAAGSGEEGGGASGGGEAAASGEDSDEDAGTDVS